MLGDNQYGLKCLQRLKGYKWIFFGNHDTKVRQELYSKELDCAHVNGYANLVKFGKYQFYLSHYPTLTSNLDDGKSLKKRTFCLCGHYHTTNPFEDIEKGISAYHVEVDAHNFYPVAFDTVVSDIESKINKKGQ